MSASFPLRTASAIALYAAICAVPEFVPALSDLKMFEWRSIGSVLDFVPRPAMASPVNEEDLRLHPEKAAANYPLAPVRDPGFVLDSFFAALERTERREPGAITRILHYGDSPIVADLITGDTRLLLQRRFGNAGHGFTLLAKPWAWYQHRDVTVHGNGWRIEPAAQVRPPDGYFGLGGVFFQSTGKATSRIFVRDAGRSVAELSYLSSPRGGEVTLRADGALLGSVSTQGPDRQSRFASFELPESFGTLSLETARGPVRLFGVTFDRKTPGVIYDSLGLNGASVTVLSKHFDEQHWASQLRHRDPHLVIVNYGTNESGFAQFVDGTYESEVREAIRRIREALPRVAILLMGPMDRGKRLQDGSIGTEPALPRLVTIQQRVALEMGCAYFDTFQAMGGPGTMGRWYAAEPRLVRADFMHPMPAGARIVASLLNRALVDAYGRYQARQKTRSAGAASLTRPAG